MRAPFLVRQSVDETNRVSRGSYEKSVIVPSLIFATNSLTAEMGTRNHSRTWTVSPSPSPKVGLLRDCVRQRAVGQTFLAARRKDRAEYCEDLSVSVNFIWLDGPFLGQRMLLFQELNFYFR